MSFTVVVWLPPPEAPAPPDAAAADALLDAQFERTSPQRDPRFAAFGAALYERFPPGLDDDSDDDAWGDGSEAGDVAGPTLTFAFFSGSRHFKAAYAHAAACAVRLGLNFHDFQSGEHILADGRRFPEGDTVDDAAAWSALLRSDWKGSRREMRQRVLAGSNQALHDLGLRLRDGLVLEQGDFSHAPGTPRMYRLGAALMELAAAKDPSRRLHRLATLEAMPEPLREQAAALRESLRVAAEGGGQALLAAIDAEISHVREQRRALSQLRLDAASASPGQWLALRSQAWDGDAWAADRLSRMLSPEQRAAARPPWPVGEHEHVDWLAVAAEWDSADHCRRLASHHLLGDGGRALDPAAALRCLRFASLGGATRLHEIILRLRARLASGWSPGRDRDRADSLMQAAAGQRGAALLATLQRACALDHPQAWRRLGDAYLHGQLGLPHDVVVGAALHLFAVKEMAGSNLALGNRRPSRLRTFAPHDIDAALDLARRLVGEPDPWNAIAEFRAAPHGSFSLQSTLFRDGHSEVRIVDRADVGGADAAPSPSLADDDAASHPLGAQLLLAAGAFGPIGLLAFDPPAPLSARWALPACAMAGAAGAWVLTRFLGWGLARRVLMSVALALPMLGTFGALVVWREILRRNPR